ncbi:hypothetical protein GPJ59_26235 [Streptomyces bambusae]|uniref:Serine/threonine protein kinase n=1 Tax=Streptomyces bambusae TaxID=1550616 RepID=A0ABS6ZBY3_9ACTN|nr:hypothetical protein [Streptomyces bambusae]
MVLTVGVLVLLVALVVLGWALLKDRKGGEGSGRNGPAGSTSSATGATGGTGRTGATGGTGTLPSGRASASASSSAAYGGSAGAGRPSASASRSAGRSPSASDGAAPGTTQQHVTVSVRTVRGSYTGPCPPPHAQAPAFVATVVVARTPTVLEYRWAVREGDAPATGSGWQSVTYEAGGPKGRQLTRTQLVRRSGAVRLEVRAPVQAWSAWVEYAVTCDEGEGPSGGPSPSRSALPVAGAATRRS